MNKLFLFALFSLFSSPFAANAYEELPPVRTVAKVDVQRYMGKWYEISSFPQSFQAGCTNSTAFYTLRDDGKVDVLNQCHLGSPNGEIKSAKGEAYAVDETFSKLRVTFFWPFYGDYWIVDLGKNYEYVAVGAPGRDYLWILSRTPTIDKRVYNGILERLEKQHFDTSKLQITRKPNAFPISEN